MARMTPDFLRARAGTSAIEFAIVAPIFLSLLFSCFEGGWYMTRAVVLDRALSDTIRLMRIGDKDAPRTQVEIKKAVCDGAILILDCMNVTTIEMTKIASASDFPQAQMACIDRAERVQPTVSFTPGTASSIMFIRACVVADPFTPGLGFALALPRDGKGGYSIRSTAAFMNEPSS